MKLFFARLYQYRVKPGLKILKAIHSTYNSHQYLYCASKFLYKPHPFINLIIHIITLINREEIQDLKC